MFQAILRRAQVALDQSIERFVSSALGALPFVIAFGFGTAALTFRLNREFGPELGNALMGGLFGVLGLIVLAIGSVRTPYVAKPAAVESEIAAASVENVAADTGAEPGPVDAADREMVMAALSSVAPLALPRILQMVLRNLPLLAVLAAALFVAFQKNENEDIGATGHPI